MGGFEQAGWALHQPVAGFAPVHCHTRTVSDADTANDMLQCLYSDGSASVSLFIKPFEGKVHPEQRQMMSMGASQLLAQRVLPETWAAAVGEVPLQTLRLFLEQLTPSH
ncbi:MAG: MucB/RseB C-terminal domain-containing protein [Burkholderiaceae bacterium]|nr:MucB/RseB C-terminal domain-containing protein [Burkholderiaceae bacterium]